MEIRFVIILSIVGGHTLFRSHKDTRKREKYFKTAVEATGQRGLRPCGTYGT